MAKLQDIIQWCDQTLKSPEFKDYAPNGLQIEGKTEVHKILVAVTASQDAIDAAIRENADLLLVHHGYFWKGEAYPITGMRGKRIKSLIQHDISLLAYHLPLDSHPSLGNNAAIADLLELERIETLDPSERHPIGNIGYLNQPMPVEDFKKFVSETLKFDVTHLPADKTMIEKVGFCTGGAQDFIVKAAEQGCDAYISGEVSERTFYEAKELGIHYFACGHHATERYGVQRLGQAISEQFDIEYVYFELNNPI
ncbi:Nif3-like dinuclear metal center hexameric protein [Acinetobacter johnsonii]|uniref:GTP cyclohydrolase 1 type 2 homolog n=1 Tax=Acinetobacter johnsonii TaxID=40214 RepID=A0A380U3E7_ACIJO|nr:Nif3-like dinuclear metal center hexameric protein [Acinetobacter johnsonii]ENU39208.1 YbgI/family dinuclear metal center protein [Acinetobacter johnsonii CIP 64.6]QPS04768.1 Nif3-like dinuclear metal center hexameric protein [Acinetobacter johnsonii]SUT95731.1 NIF3 (NGG1p interacting factor 3) family protein [Acinetobacter johnsonii]